MSHERPQISINVAIHVTFLWKVLFKRYLVTPTTSIGRNDEDYKKTVPESAQLQQ